MKWRSILTIGLSAALCLGLRGSDENLWKSSETLRRLGVERIALSDFREGLPLLQAATEQDPHSALAVAALANAYHLQRRLDEAAVQYAQLLRLNPATLPNQQQQDAIVRFAPRVFQSSSDPFGLKDVVAIHHPNEPMIAYHFLWEDDIDFPEDNDPCDHELVWLRYDRGTQRITEFYTYFHGRLLRAVEALEDGHRHEERARVNVQWGKHGSMPSGWERLSIQANSGDIESRYLDLTKPVSLDQYNRATYRKLHDEGRRMIDHPLARSWPRRFEGSWEDFVTFTKEVDVLSMLKERGMMSASEWNNAVLQQHFLPYNFRPKTEWPGDEARDGALEVRRSLAPRSDNLIRVTDTVRPLPDDLPPDSLFKPETPRYPNVWFYGAESDFSTYAKFVEWLETRFRGAGYRPDEVSLNEGADVALSIEHLQPWTSMARLSHAHALHIRFFWKRLQQGRIERVKFGDGGTGRWRVAASVHYEVEHASPLHADVEVCPFCGRTGAYAEKAGSLVEQVHDPLGLELLLRGTIRGEPAEFPEHSKTFPSIDRLLNSQPSEWIVTKRVRSDMNTEVVAVIPVAVSKRR